MQSLKHLRMRNGRDLKHGCRLFMRAREIVQHIVIIYRNLMHLGVICTSMLHSDSQETANDHVCAVFVHSKYLGQFCECNLWYSSLGKVVPLSK